MTNETNTSYIFNTIVFDDSIWVETPVTIFLLFMEMLLYLISNVGCILFSILLVTKRVFHHNLAILLGNMVFIYTLLSISRYYNIFQTIAVYFVPTTTKLNYYLICWLVNTFYNIAMFNTAMSPIILVVERVIATVFVKTYEKSQVYFVIFFFLAQVTSFWFSRNLECQRTKTKFSKIQQLHVIIIELWGKLSDLIVICCFQQVMREKNSFLWEMRTRTLAW